MPPPACERSTRRSTRTTGATTGPRFEIRVLPRSDLVVTQPGTKGDAHHRRAWELLASDPGLLAEYRRLKASSEEYEQRKAAFFDRVVMLLESR
jgi:hypothetical protein